MNSYLKVLLGTFALLLSGCAVTQHQTSASVCPPIKAYTPEQEKQVAAELHMIPFGSETYRWIGDYIALRDELRACQTAPKVTP